MPEILDVRDFHKAFDAPIITTPVVPSEERQKLRIKLIQEEYTELMAALESGNLAEIAKEAADLRYVIFGMELEYGIPSGKIWDAVHESNMAKLGPDGKPIRREDGKVIKPEGWQKPNIQAILDQANA